MSYVEIYNITPESVETTYDFLIIYYPFKQKISWYSWANGYFIIEEGLASQHGKNIHKQDMRLLILMSGIYSMIASFIS